MWGWYREHSHTHTHTNTNTNFKKLTNPSDSVLDYLRASRSVSVCVSLKLVTLLRVRHIVPPPPLPCLGDPDLITNNLRPERIRLPGFSKLSLGVFCSRCVIISGTDDVGARIALHDVTAHGRSVDNFTFSLATQQMII